MYKTDTSSKSTWSCVLGVLSLLLSGGGEFEGEMDSVPEGGGVGVKKSKSLKSQSDPIE